MCDDRFEVVVHHGGYFERNETRWSYSNGLTSMLACDPDRWSYFEIMEILREMGYVNIKDLWYNVSRSKVLENNLKHLTDDIGAMQMVRIARSNGQVHMYVNHSICEAEVVDNFLEYFPEEVVAEIGTTNVEVQAEVDGHSGCGDGDHINPVQDNNVVHEAEMQQDKNVCDMEYELEDDADSHHNIRVEPQTEFEETGGDVVGVGKETGADAVVEGHETGADRVGVGKETGVDAEVEGDEAGADGVAIDKETGVRAEGDEAGADGVVVDKETGADAVGEGGETGAEAHEAVGGEERNEDETDSDLVDVSVHYEDNLWEGNGEEDSEDEDLEFDGSDHVDMRDRGLSDDGWESYDMYSEHCTCRKWSLIGIPCCHAVAAIKFLNLSEEDFVPHWFRISTYEETYNSIIYPCNEQQMWTETEFPDVLPPSKRILPRRPKKKRRLEAWEMNKNGKHIIKHGMTKKCSICK